MKTTFHSELFGIEFTKTDKGFVKFVIAELLYWILHIEKQNCYYFEHNKALEKYRNELKKREARHNVLYIRK